MRTALLVPCYNAEAFLPLLHEQVSRLQPAFNEVILADDGSTDATASTAAAMGFKVLSLHSNRGPGGARNALAAAATSDWIHFHDVDDELAPDYLARVQPNATSDCDVVMHFVDFIDAQTRCLEIRWKFDLPALTVAPQATLLAQPMPTQSSMIRRQTFLDIGGFNELHRCFEDADLHFRLACHGARIKGMPEVLEWGLRRSGGAGSNQHYCYQCRLAFLLLYESSCGAKLSEALGKEAERVAVMLLRAGDTLGALTAIQLAERLGKDVPTTSNIAIKLLKKALPQSQLRLLRAQDKMRQSLQRIFG
ncbi:MAG: glycosyltransferase family A protein [Ramlibacter sp.]|nr:glycosyltransferase family A protein [Ramlibacter sp.]